MEAEVMKERLDKLFLNEPAENIEHLPPDIQKVIDDAVEESARLFLLAVATGAVPIRSAICGVIGQAFFAGHNYAVDYGNLMAEMKEMV